MNRPSPAPIGEDATYNRSDDRQDPRGHCKARARWPRSRSQGDRPCASRCGYGGHLHGPASDPRADRRNGRPRGRGRHRHLDPLGRAHDARSAHSGTAAERGRRGRAGARRRHDSRPGRRGSARAGRRCGLHSRDAYDGHRRLPARARGRPGDVDRRQHARPGLGRDREPPGVLNALSTELLEELLAAFRGLADDDECGVAVLTGAGDRAFIAGADIAELATKTPLMARKYSEHGQDLSHLLETMRKPTIAAVNGYRAGRRLRDGAGLRSAASPRRRRASVSPRSTSASSPAGAARSVWRARRRSASPRSSCSRVAWSRPTRRSIAVS